MLHSMLILQLMSLYLYHDKVNKHVLNGKWCSEQIYVCTVIIADIYQF